MKHIRIFTLLAALFCTAALYAQGTYSDLAGLITAASSGSTITLTKNYTYNSGTDSGMAAKGLEINGKTITIDLNGYTISGNNAARLFYIYSGATLTVNNSGDKSTGLLANGICNTGSSDTDRHRALRVYGTLNIGAGVTIKDCQNTNSNGGAMRVEKGGVLNMTDASFSGCKATTSTAGAIYADETAKINLENVSFINCSSKSEGGAFVSNVVDISNCKLTNCTFSGCSSILGGAICVNSDRCIQLIGGEFNNCKATGGNGGGIFCNGTVNISGTKFTGCSSVKSGSTAYGGALYIGKKACTVENAIFDGCSAQNGGGAIGVIKAESASELTLTGGEVKNCTAADGGGIYTEAKVTVKNTDFTGCSSTSNAGAIRVHANGTCSITGGTFSTCSSGSGGAIYATGKTTIDGVKFDGCHGKYSSGTTPATNTYGGALLADTATADYCIVKNSSFENCVSAYGGAICLNTGKYCKLNGCTITGCSATINSGAIFNHGKLTLINSEITGCSSAYCGGVLVKKQPNATLDLSGKVIIKDNTSTDGKGINNLAVVKNIVTKTADLTGSDIFFTIISEDSSYNPLDLTYGTLTSGYSANNPSAELDTYFHYEGSTVKFTPVLESGEIKVLANARIIAHEDPSAPGTYWATFYDGGSYATTLPEGVAAYIGSAGTGNVTLSPMDGNIIPAGEAVVLKSNTGEYYLPWVKSTLTPDEINVLKGSDTDLTQESGKTYYMLSAKGEETAVVGFYQVKPEVTIGAHKAYYSTASAL